MAKSLEQLVRENIDNIREWRSEGFTANQICRKLNMKVRTLYLYLRTIPELADAWEFGNTKLVKDVLEPALLKQALQGMPYIETVEEMVKMWNPVTEKEEMQMVVTKKVHKVIYNPNILKYVLSCLDPNKWGKQSIKDEAKMELSPEMDSYGV
jgi:hypothetical protein